jgi:hypothetical protein
MAKFMNLRSTSVGSEHGAGSDDGDNDAWQRAEDMARVRGAARVDPRWFLDMGWG